MTPPKNETADESRLRLIIRDETNNLLMAHLKLCPFVSNEVEKRLRAVEMKSSTIAGLIIGSNILGAATGATVAKMLL